ncbi:MAG TPA: hypothetical protein VGR35_09290 [Tepidisphaeraceae bacterium]|nr:hypothetical protein [Tepidisphaeraceae bacterium]
MRILVTGFEPFGGHAMNPSMEVVTALPTSERLIRRVLPVIYADAGRIIRDLITAERPDAVLSLGLCGRSPSILLERIAINLNDDTCGDNTGDSAHGRLIDPAGPVGYWSTLPLVAIHEALRERGIAVAFSSHAGTYVCNHVFYVVRHMIEQQGGDQPCGFVHLPPVGSSGLSLGTLVDAVRTCLGVIERHGARK